MKIAARTALALGLVIGGLAISDFAYNAYQRASGLDAISSVDRDGRRVGNGGDDPPNANMSHFEELQQLDAAAALLAAAFLLTSTVISRRIKLHRR